MPLAKVWAKPRRGQNPKWLRFLPLLGLAHTFARGIGAHFLEYLKVSKFTLKPSSALGGRRRSIFDPTISLNAIFGFLGQLLSDANIIFQKRVDNFEIERKTWLILVRGAVPPYPIRHVSSSQ